MVVRGPRLSNRPHTCSLEETFEVPCGKCRGCRLEKSREWAIRCVHEAQMHERNCFVTLTYDEEHLPRDRSVDVREWQLFAKRLRNSVGRFRFFMCGEYGEEKLRPHYHAILFGIDFSEDRELWKKSSANSLLFTSKTLDSAWKKGWTSIGDCTFQSAAYVARYAMKKHSSGTAERYRRVFPDGTSRFVRPEFGLQSRRPGIGRAWFEKFKSDVFPDDFVVHDGQKVKTPRYYENLLSEAELAEVKARRKAAGEMRGDGERTRSRLRQREACQAAKEKLLVRSSV